MSQSYIEKRRSCDLYVRIGNTCTVWEIFTAPVISGYIQVGPGSHIYLFCLFLFLCIFRSSLCQLCVLHYNVAPLSRRFVTTELFSIYFEVCAVYWSI